LFGAPSQRQFRALRHETTVNKLYLTAALSFEPAVSLTR
jgi:hypothetical protein